MLLLRFVSSIFSFVAVSETLDTNLSMVLCLFVINSLTMSLLNFEDPKKSDNHEHEKNYHSDYYQDWKPK